MLHRLLAMSEEQTTYQQAERQAAMMHQMTIFHSSPADFMHTQEESTDESIATYREFKRLVEEYADEHFVPSVVEEFCKKVYEDDDHFIFFKPFCNLYYSVYADALLWYQQGRIDYDTFCQELDFILRFLAMPKLKQVWLLSSGLMKTLQNFPLGIAKIKNSSLRFVYLLLGFILQIVEKVHFHDDTYTPKHVGIYAGFLKDVIGICSMTSQFTCQPDNSLALFF